MLSTVPVAAKPAVKGECSSGTLGSVRPSAGPKGLSFPYILTISLDIFILCVRWVLSGSDVLIDFGKIWGAMNRCPTSRRTREYPAMGGAF